MSSQFPENSKRDPKSMIAGFRWDETSGVDHGANLEDGWLVMKAAEIDGLDIDPEVRELLKSELVTIEGERRLYMALKSFNPEVDGTPDEVRASVATLQTWLTEQGYDELLEPTDKAAEESTEEEEAAEGDLEDLDKAKKPPFPPKTPDAKPGAKPDAEDEADGGDDEEAEGEPPLPPKKPGAKPAKKSNRLSVKDLLFAMIQSAFGRGEVAKQAAIDESVDEDRLIKALEDEIPAFSDEIAKIFLSSGDIIEKTALIDTSVTALTDRVRQAARS